MSKNKYSQAQKKKICDKHKSLVRLIYRIGFEKILQQQAVEIALLFGYYAHERDVKMAIQELEKYQLIKKIPTANSNKFLILCKYARAYVRGIEDSQKVAALDSSMTPANQFDRIARVELFIGHCKKEKYTKFKQVKSFNTFLVREDVTHEFYEQLIKTRHPQLNTTKLTNLYNKALNEYNFKPALVDKNHQLKQKTEFDLDIDAVTLRQLIQKKIYMENLTQSDTHMFFDFYLVDANNRYTTRKFRENVLYIQNFVDNIIHKQGKLEFFIKIIYVCTDPNKRDALMKDLNHRAWDNKRARYESQSKLDKLDPIKTLETMRIQQKIELKVLKSNYFKIHKNLE